MPVTERQQSGDRRGVTISDRVPAGATGRKMRYSIPKSGTVESVSVRIYEGAELDLELTPYIDHEGDDGTTDLITQVGKEHIDGDDDVYRYSVSLPVSREDTLVISATNQSDQYDYDYRVNVEIDFAGGSGRIFGGVL